MTAAFSLGADSLDRARRREERQPAPSISTAQAPTGMPRNEPAAPLEPSQLPVTKKQQSHQLQLRRAMPEAEQQESYWLLGREQGTHSPLHTLLVVMLVRMAKDVLLVYPA